MYGNDEIDGTGNNLANSIEGNAAKNHLIGGGGSDKLDGGGGEDILEGGLGDDTYLIDNVGVTLTELANEGIDTVSASISFILGAEFEQLQLTSSRNIDGTGNDAANIILGNDGANRLDGKGGADQLTGGKGNDVYVLGDADLITEVNDEGTDTVEISDAFAGGDYALLDFFRESDHTQAPRISTARVIPPKTLSLAIPASMF